MSFSKISVLICAVTLCLLPLQSLVAADTARAEQKNTQAQVRKTSGAAEDGVAAGEDIAPGFKSTLGNKISPPAPGKSPEEKLAMLSTLLKQGSNLRKDAAQVQQSMERNPESADSTALVAELNALNQQLNESSHDFERIATGVELSIFAPKKEVPFNWKDEFSALIDPMIKEMRALTANTKKRADLREEITTLAKQTNTAAQALANLQTLIEASQDKAMDRQLRELKDSWHNEHERLQGKLDLAQMELQSLTTQDGSLWERTGQRMASFFKNRGLYLILALLAFAVTFFLLRYLFSLVLRRIPSDKSGRPHMYARFISIFSQFASLLLALIALLAVFYIAADWFMLSLVLLLFIGMLWALRQTLPRQWQQSLLMLNMGPVREGERLVLDGVPWRVDSLGMFCRLSNPTLNQALRMPIESMLNRVSRPYDLSEPWFPCKKGDFIRLDENTVAQVISLSHEQVEVVRAGMTTTYPTATFLGMAAANMAQKFTVSTTLGLSYGLQAEITDRIPKILRSYLENRLDGEGYSSKCLSVTCEFSRVNNSSLDIAVILEFQGDMASLYYRLRRALQRWCVDCCTENRWDIPFNQIVVHNDKPA